MLYYPLNAKVGVPLTPGLALKRLPARRVASSVLEVNPSAALVIYRVDRSSPPKAQAVICVVGSSIWSRVLSHNVVQSETIGSPHPFMCIHCAGRSKLSEGTLNFYVESCPTWVAPIAIP